MLYGKNGSLSLLGGGINTGHNEGMADLNSSGDEMIFTRCFTDIKTSENDCKLYISKRQGDAWSEGVMLPFCDPDYNYVHGKYGNTDDEIIFSSDIEGGRGKYDIYKISKLNGKWSDAMLLSGQINTSEDELFPFLIKDTLFFSSRGHNSFGGLDVYKSVQVAPGRWSQAINMRKPINSGYDDFAYVILEGKDDLERFVCSSREGDDNIYQIIKLKTVDEPEVVLDTPKIILSLSTFTIDANSGFELPLKGTPPNVNSKENSTLQSVKSESNLYEYVLEPGMKYRISLKLDDYYAVGTEISTEEIFLIEGGSDVFLEEKLVLKPIIRNREIVLEDIYYDFDRWDIRADAEPSLDNLAKLLFDNPDIRIQLSSHTDCRGDADYNLDLSQKRAESAKNYLVGKGINSDRIQAKGLGENVRKTDCRCTKCSEDEYQLDRRTSFTILS